MAQNPNTYFDDEIQALNSKLEELKELKKLNIQVQARARARARAPFSFDNDEELEQAKQNLNKVNEDINKINLAVQKLKKDKEDVLNKQEPFSPKDVLWLSETYQPKSFHYIVEGIRVAHPLNNRAHAISDVNPSLGLSNSIGAAVAPKKQPIKSVNIPRQASLELEYEHGTLVLAPMAEKITMNFNESDKNNDHTMFQPFIEQTLLAFVNSSQKEKTIELNFNMPPKLQKDCKDLIIMGLITKYVHGEDKTKKHFYSISTNHDQRLNEILKALEDGGCITETEKKDYKKFAKQSPDKLEGHGYNLSSFKDILSERETAADAKTITQRKGFAELQKNYYFGNPQDPLKMSHNIAVVSQFIANNKPLKMDTKQVMNALKQIGPHPDGDRDVLIKQKAEFIKKLPDFPKLKRKCDFTSAAASINNGLLITKFYQDNQVELNQLNIKQGDLFEIMKELASADPASAPATPRSSR